MPVNAIAPTDPATTAPPAPAPGSTDGGEGGFAAALDQAMRPSSPQPTVTLSAMLDAVAGKPVAASDVREDLTPASLAQAGSAGRLDGVPADATPEQEAVLAAAERYLGVPYRWGGTDPATGLDCSGFVQRAFADVGVDLPRVSIDQSKQGVEVPGGLDGAQPGDLLFWSGDGSRPNHIAIYVGDGRMLEAPSAGDVVSDHPVTRTPDAVRRVL
ncbi:MAG: C40 family peptidase [Nitriliruptoraceae bacterium]